MRNNPAQNGKKGEAMKLKKALLVVDLQNDFCPEGALAVPEGDKIIPEINGYLGLFSRAGLPIFATRDWHPEKTRHFRDFGGIWPVHCVEGTKGAEFHPGLKLPTDAILLYKGMDPQEDSYSAFQAKDAEGKGFLQILKALKIGEIYIGGLATDYCVKFTTRDAVKKGFKVNILIDAIKGVNLRKDDSENAIKGMLAIGAKKVTLKDLKWKK